ncbi:hypothetical protein AAFM79_19775 [Trichormus azollae HNT15244]
MSWRMEESGIKQSQGFQVIDILLRSYVYLCLPTYPSDHKQETSG